MSDGRKFSFPRSGRSVPDHKLDRLVEGAKVREATEESRTPAQLRQEHEKAFTLTLDPEITATVDRLRLRPLKLSRRQWIRVAILEKIERDSQY